MNHTPKFLAALLQASCLLTLCLHAGDLSTPVVGVLPELDQVDKWNDMHGDTADPFWADDDNLYHFTCDGRGFGTQKRNLCLNRLTGADLLHLKGELVNSMDEYGKDGAKAPDGSNWKVTGQECIDGVFYTFVACNRYGKDSKDPLMRQTSFNSSLITSTNRGRTWKRTARENYDAPMWPGGRFGAPAFIHYGRNGGNVQRDGADKFVYVVSNNGFWNGGDDFILARVRRADLPKLNTGDWQYFIGGDGLDEQAWTDDIAKAMPIVSRPAKLGWTAPAFVPELNRYVLVSWYVTPTLKNWFKPGRVVYDFLESPHPWGPWTMVGSFDDRFLGGEHMYGPNLCAKYQERVEGGVKVELFTSGCPFDDKPEGLYKAWRIPVILRTTPLPAATEVNDDDSSVQYSGDWTVVTTRKINEAHGDVYHSTSATGAAAEFHFTGTGVEILAQKFQDSGEIAVSLDGQSRGKVNLKLKNFPRLVQVPVFRVEGLRDGEHKLKIELKGGGVFALDGFRVLH